MKIIAIANNKGGCGKTTTAFYLAQLLACQYRTLLIDLDPQANLTERFASELALSLPNGYRLTIADVLGGASAKVVNLAEAIYSVEGNLYLCPSEPQLANVALGLLNDPVRGRTALRRALRTIDAKRFDVVVVDSPPEQGVLLVNALLAADGVICPAEPENDALMGIRRVTEMVNFIRSDDGRETPVLLGMVATKTNARANRHQDGIDLMRRSKASPLLAVIPARDGEGRDRDLRIAYQPVMDTVVTWMGESNHV